LILKKIATILRENGNSECLKKASLFETQTSKTTTLHFRNLDLNTANIMAIAAILREEKEHHGDGITSISFSYNHRLGDLGVTHIIKSLPASVSEIGLVNCGIGDKGGYEILHWMKATPNLQMICMEQNNFSDTLQTEFNIFKKENPTIMVIF
jgi:hypothetical protein